jgi:hypothetical protein
MLLNNQRDAALSSRTYSSLRDYMFRVLSAPIIRSTIKTVDAIIGTVHVSVWCGSNTFKDVQSQESISLLCINYMNKPVSISLTTTTCLTEQQVLTKIRPSSGSQKPFKNTLMFRCLQMMGFRSKHFAQFEE